MSGEGHKRERRRAARRRLGSTAAAVALHALALLALWREWGDAPTPWETPPMEVVLVAPPPPRPPAPRLALEPAAAPTPTPKRRAAPAPPKPAAPRPPPVPHRLAKAPPPPRTPPRIVPPEPAPPMTEVLVSAAELAAATTAETEAAGGGAGEGQGMGAGEGGGTGGGGRCDMVGRLQRALRNDGSVRAALARARRAPGFERRPLMVWNGDWVRHGDEEGKGLASLRQAIAVEVAFAPKACRAQRMKGLVLLSLNDAPGAVPVVLGTGTWRWSDLLALR